MREGKARLDWRFHILLQFAEIRLRELKRFYDEATTHFKRDFKRLQEEFTEQNTEDSEEMVDYFVDRRDELESLLDLKQEFGIIGLYTMLERFLRLVLGHLRDAGEPIPAETKPWYMDTLKDKFMLVNVKVTQPPFAWTKIKKLQAIRKCIAHEEGWVDKERAKILRTYGLKVKGNEFLKLPDGYFLEAWNLVKDTCRQVIKECQKKPTKAERV
jgi:hypothetical protein